MFGKKEPVSVSVTQDNFHSTKQWVFTVGYKKETYKYTFTYTTSLSHGWSTNLIQPAIFEVNHTAIADEFMRLTGIKSDDVYGAVLGEILVTIPNTYTVG